MLQSVTDSNTNYIFLYSDTSNTFHSALQKKNNNNKFTFDFCSSELHKYILKKFHIK